MFKLIELPYSLDALEPVISARTLSFHHGKHLKGYVDNLNKLIEGTEFRSFVAGAPQDDKPTPCHSEAYPVLAEGRSEESPLLKQITTQWGTLEAFKAAFVAKGAGLFGSGWVWLAAKEDGELVILQCPGADNPVCHFEHSQKGGAGKALRPILTFDVWEHAYYLDYQNRRPDHLNALWDIIDWNVLEERYENNNL